MTENTKRIPRRFRIFDEYSKEPQFRVNYSPIESSGGSGFLGYFDECASKLAYQVVMHEKKHDTFIQNAARLFYGNGLTIEGVENETKKLLATESLIGENQIKIAQDAFYGAFPAQAYLLIALNLASEYQLDIRKESIVAHIERLGEGKVK